MKLAAEYIPVLFFNNHEHVEQLLVKNTHNGLEIINEAEKLFKEMVSQNLIIHPVYDLVSLVYGNHIFEKRYFPDGDVEYRFQKCR